MNKKREYWNQVPEDSPYRTPSDGLAFGLLGRRYFYVYSVDHAIIRRYPLNGGPETAEQIHVYADRNDVLRKSVTQLAGHFGLAKAQGRLKQFEGSTHG